MHAIPWAYEQHHSPDSAGVRASGGPLKGARTGFAVFAETGGTRSKWNVKILTCVTHAYPHTRRVRNDTPEDWMAIQGEGGQSECTQQVEIETRPSNPNHELVQGQLVSNQERDT